MHYLAWLKEMLARLGNVRGLCNLALSGVSRREDKKWFRRQLSRQRELLVLLDEPAEYGLPSLREAIGETFCISPPHELLLMTGASRAVARFYETLVANYPNCAIAVESPTYGPLVEIPTRLGAKVLRFSRERMFEELPLRLSGKTRAVVLTNPNNPTSHFLEAAEQLKLLEVVHQHAPNALLMVDHTFAGATSLERLPLRNHPRVVIVGSLSKSFGGRLNLLRTGWIAASRTSFPDLFSDWSLFENSGCKLSEALATLAIPDLSSLGQAANEHLKRHRPLLEHWVSKRLKDGSIQPCILHHGTVCFLRLAEISDTDDFAQKLVTDFRVLVAPGGFFEERPSNAIRIGIGGDATVLKRGLKRLTLALKREQGT
jgi:aspartate/methionine/tyrosine aminotransferase